jgi:hypothetical protein
MTRAEVEAILGGPPVSETLVLADNPVPNTPCGIQCEWTSDRYWIRVHFDEDGCVLSTTGSAVNSCLDKLCRWVGW